MKNPTYRSWCAMKNRCMNKNSVRYSSYGGRGISICEEWITSYDVFATDMGIRPENTVLDRIDNNGNYGKSNCRWATLLQSMNNTRRSVLSDPIKSAIKEAVCTRKGSLREVCRDLQKRYSIPSETIRAYIKRHLWLNQP